MGAAPHVRIRVRPRHRRERGFTLLELMLGTLMISVMLVGVLGLIATSYAMSRSAHEITEAKNAAERKMEEIRELARARFADVLLTYGEGSTDRNFDVGALTPVPSDSDGKPGLVTVAPSVMPGNRLLDVTVGVEWRGTGGNQTFELQSRVSGN